MQVPWPTQHTHPHSSILAEQNYKWTALLDVAIITKLICHFCSLKLMSTQELIYNCLFLLHNIPSSITVL